MSKRPGAVSPQRVQCEQQQQDQWLHTKQMWVTHNTIHKPIPMNISSNTVSSSTHCVSKTFSTNFTRVLPGSGRCRRSRYQSPGWWERLWPSHIRSWSRRRWPPAASSHLETQVTLSNTETSSAPQRLQSSIQPTPPWWISSREKGPSADCKTRVDLLGTWSIPVLQSADRYWWFWDWEASSQMSPKVQLQYF